MTKFFLIPAFAILAIFSTFTIGCDETKTPELMQIATKDLHDKYEERKEEERQFIKGIQDEHEEAIEKKIEEAEKLKEHIIHKKDSTLKKDTEKNTKNHNH